jgi:hypothetical protein
MYLWDLTCVNIYSTASLAQPSFLFTQITFVTYELFIRWAREQLANGKLP